MPDLSSQLITYVQADIKNFTKNIDTAQKQASSFGSSVSKSFSNIGAALAGAGLLSGFKKIYDEIDDIGAISSRLDVTTQSLQKLQYIAAQTDTEFSAIEGGLEKLRKRLGEATSGSEEATKAFSSLGLDAQALAAGDLGDAYFQVGDAIKGVSGSTNQAKRAIDVFGKSGQSQLNALRSNMRGLAKEATDIGYVLSDADFASFNELDQQVNRLAFSIKADLYQAFVGLGPIIQNSVKVGTASLSTLEKVTSKVSLGISDGFSAADDLVKRFSNFINDTGYKGNDGGANTPYLPSDFANRTKFSNVQDNANKSKLFDSIAGSVSDPIQEIFKAAAAVRQLGVEALKSGATLRASSDGLKDLLGISAPSGKDYLASILPPIQQITDSRFTEIATQLRNNIDSGKNIGGSPESLIGQLKSISAQYVGGNVLDGQSASGMQAAIKALEEATTGIKQENKVVVEIKVDKNGIITAFSDSSSGQAIFAQAIANAAAKEAGGTMAQ